MRIDGHGVSPPLRKQGTVTGHATEPPFSPMLKEIISAMPANQVTCSRLFPEKSSAIAGGPYNKEQSGRDRMQLCFEIDLFNIISTCLRNGS